MRLMGLDYGDKTIGVAISDGTKKIASGLEIIRRDDEASIKKSVFRLSEIIKEYEIDTIILGFPINMNGTFGDRCHKTRDFKSRLERNFKKIPVILHDERLSSISARRVLLEADISRKKQKQVIDKQAAVFILQNYLDMFNNNKLQEKEGVFVEQ